MNKAIKLSLTALVAGSLVLTPIQNWGNYDQVTYAATQSKAFSGMKLKTFNIGNGSTVQIKDVLFQYGASSKKVYFTVDVYNGGSNTIDYMDYWLYLNSKSGANFKLTGLPSNPADTRVSAKTTKQFIYYAEIDSKLNYSDLSFKLVKWDFGAANYTREIGTVSITQAYANTVPADSFYVLKWNGGTVKSYITNAYSVNTGTTTNQIQLKLGLANESSTAVNADFKYYLQAKSGQIVALSPTEANASQLDVKGTKDIMLVADVNKNIDLKDAKLLLTRIEGKDNLEVPIANYAIKWNASSGFVTAANKTKKVSIEKTSIDTLITNVYANKGATTNDIIINMKMNNKGNKEVKLPNYTYSVMTTNGKIYKATLQETDITLLPEKEKEITLYVEVPTAYSQNLTLFITKPKGEDSTPEYILSAFALKGIEATPELNSKVYKSGLSTYQLAIDTIERIPWGDEDILNVYLKVSNIGKDAAAIPDFKGDILFNGITVDGSTSSWVKLDSQIMIEPTKSTSYVISMKIPYTYTFSKLNLNVIDQISKDKTQTVANFTSSKLLQVPVLEADSVYTISSIGRKSKVTVDRMYKFESNRSNLIYVDLGMTNEEQRAKTLPALKAYFRTSNNDIYEAELVDVESRVNSNGKAVVTVAAAIPSSVETFDDFELVIGEAMQKGAFSPTSKDADSFINSVGFKLKETTSAISKDLRNIELPMHSLDIRRIETVFSGTDNIGVTMNYTLTNQYNYANDNRTRKVIFELATPDASFDQTVELGDKGLKEGHLQNYTVNFTGDAITTKAVNGYTLNVYEEYNGYKRLVGTTKVNSYTRQ
jgi:hypothetical protein